MKFCDKGFAFILSVCCVISGFLKAQPFIDPASFNSQFFQSTYKDSLHPKNKTIDYNLNIFIPKKFKNENNLLVRFAYGNVHSQRDSVKSDVYSLTTSVGFQFASKNKKWKTMVMGIPRINGDLRDNISKDIQYGGLLLFTYVKNDSLLKLKFGVFYNRECFGNFFVPLLGIDWKLSNRLSIYGILPNNMRVEYKANKRLYLGLGFKNYKRSYRLCSDLNNDFITVKETQAKLFFDLHLTKHLVLFGDAAYMIKYDFAQYAVNDLKMDTPLLYNAVYSPMNGNFVFTAGIAYRVRLD